MSYLPCHTQATSIINSPISYNDTELQIDYHIYTYTPPPTRRHANLSKQHTVISAAIASQVRSAYSSSSLSLSASPNENHNNMTTNKATDTAPTTNPHIECCMCGDSGFSDELFQCKLCQFRSQHRYCSNLYPKAESYRICNWCLSQKEDTKEKSPNSSNSSSSHRNNGSADDDGKTRRLKKGLRGNGLHVQLKKNPIKKQSSLEINSSPPSSPSLVSLPSPRKRIITSRALEERLRRTKSEDITNRTTITRPVFRNKVRRYKLLDEVSS